MNAVDFHFGQYVRHRFGTGLVVLRRDADALEYESAVDEFASLGNRPALFARLLALGVPADQIRWHAENPGHRRVTIWADGAE